MSHLSTGRILTQGSARYLKSSSGIRAYTQCACVCERESVWVNVALYFFVLWHHRFGRLSLGPYIGF